MHPEIASIHQRLEKGGDWMEFRNEIARLHGEAATQDEYVSLLEAHRRLVTVAEHCFDTEKCAEIRRIAAGEYKLFLNAEAMENGTINPMLLDRITAREVEAGRMSADDDFRLFASAGSQLGDTAEMRFDRRLANIAALTGLLLGAIVFFSFSKALGVGIFLAGVVVGWMLNERRRKAAIADANATRSARGYD